MLVQNPGKVVAAGSPTDNGTIASSKSLLVDNAKLVGEFLRANLSEAPLRAGYILILIFGGFGSGLYSHPLRVQQLPQAPFKSRAM